MTSDFKSNTLPLILILVLKLNFLTSCQNHKDVWLEYKEVKQAGYSEERLEQARLFYDSLQSSALMVVQDGKIIVAWGKINQNFRIASIRKSLLNSLYGIYHDNGTIDLNLTLKQLNISDKDSLSDLEKSAKIIHLLKARSGVYHKAAAETESIRQYRPARNSHPPDSFWFYNNWDFNVLGTIFEKLIKTSIFEAFNNKIAIPLHMEDFKTSDCEYFYEKEYSIHPAYHFKMSARDLARFGQLYLQKGVWNDKQIISEEWIEQSTFPQSKHGGGAKIGRWYGYLWGVSEYYQQYKMFFASGVGGQFLAVFPTENLVIVNLSDTDANKKVLNNELIKLFDLILKAKIGKPLKNPRLTRLKISK